jgi:hypothetical protein
MEDPGDDDEWERASDYWLAQPLQDERDWTRNLGRQLGLRDDEIAGVHDTLLLVVRELDNLIRVWPPPLEDGNACQQLAHEATKNLQPVELYATLMAGPPRWREARVQGCKIGKLAGQLQPALEKALAAGLNQVLGRWVKWDIRELRKRRDAAIRAVQEASVSAPRVPYQRPEGRERWERLKPAYRPPGRT